MLTVISLILSYGYSTIIAAVFFSRTLERRYSYKITACGSVLCWVAHCLLKLPFFFCVGVPNMAVFNGIGLLFMFAYQISLYRAAPIKRILSMVLYYGVMFFGEMLSTHVATLIFGENRFLQTESAYTVAGTFIICLWATLALYPAVCLWDLLMSVGKGRGEKRLWLCVLLPLSQCLLLEYFVDAYESKFRNIPPWSFGGMALGLLLDFYMFFLFYRENRQYHAERELLMEREIYSRERVYYENLRKNQEETAKIRHDFQNYILTLDHMAKGRRTNR